MSLLNIVGDAMVMCGLARPSIVYASTDIAVQEFKLWAQAEGDDLVMMDWPQQHVLLTLTGNGTATRYDLPQDFSRWAGGNTLYIDGEANGPLVEVTSDRMLQAKAQVYNPVRPIWRRIGDTVEFYPAPENGEVIKGEYRSEYWILDSTLVTRKPIYTADDDEAVFPDSVMRLGVAWRWKRSKGLFYEDIKADYDRQKMVHFANMTGRKDIRLSTVYKSDMPVNYADPQITVPS